MSKPQDVINFRRRIKIALVKSFAPTYFAKTTLEPIEKATKKLTNKLVKAVFAPTAATALSPLNMPITATSAALNKICNMLVKINGIE